MRRRLTLWAVLVALAVGAGAVVLIGGGGGSTGLAKLPLASGGGTRQAAGMAADASMPLRQVTYVAGKDLPCTPSTARPPTRPCRAWPPRQA
jgi:hypothetical protein